jgi:ABC-type oligopeptide transport system substrate-binding subunit
MPLFMPVPTELVEELGADWRDQFGQFAGGWQTAVNLVTSGPFFPTPRDAYGQRVTLHRNPEWPIRRLGNVDRVNILFMDDENAVFKAWEAKSLDLSMLPPAEQAGMLERAPHRMTLVPNQTVFYLSFNFDSPVFREPAVRQAFSSAIDRERLVEEVFGVTGALPMRHLTPPGVLGAPPIDEIGGGYSPDFARLKMSESSFGGCPQIPPITLMVSSADLSLLQAEIIRGMWVEELGCSEEQIVIEQVQFGGLLANTRRDAGAARPDIWELGWSSYYPDAHNWLNDLLHCQHSENRQNRPCGPVDEQIVEASTLSSLPERTALYRQIENTFFDGGGIVPIIPLYVRGEVELVQNWVKYTPATFGGEQFDTYSIDADTKRLERSR